MPPIVRTRILFFLLGMIVVPLGTVLVIYFARGYRLNQGQIQPTGLLVAHSYPDGAEVYVNDKLAGATSTSFNLSPGSYVVTIKKDGFYDWIKKIQIQAEIVTRATAVLFPTVPSLKAVTSKGALNPTLSTDGSKIAYARNDGAASSLYTLDLSDSPLGLLNRESRLLTTSETLDFSKMKLSWSPDQRQLVASIATGSAYLIDVNNPKLIDITLTRDSVFADWNQRIELKEQQQFISLPPHLQTILATSSADLVWAPNETKLLYTATASAMLPDNLIRPLPGSSTQPQTRVLKPGGVYVYDLEEDRNFLVGQAYVTAPTATPAPSLKAKKTPVPTPKASVPTAAGIHPSGLAWFPTSSHLFWIEGNKVMVKEYDNQNQQVIYAGPFEDSFAFPYPSGTQLLILTNITPTNSPNYSPLPNLYSVSLR